MTRHRTTARRTASMGVGAAALALLAVGCTIPVDGEGVPATPTTTRADGSAHSPDPTDGPSGAGSSADATGPATSGDVPEEWVAAIREAAATYGGTAGIAAAGPDGEPVTAGDLQEDVAWSTSKVPLAVAAVRDHGVDADVTAALTVSDNQAAENMWASLGDPATAAAAVDRVLRDGGDATTRTQSEPVRAGYTAFGQTRWALADQARFGAHLRCIASGPAVLDVMSGVAADQSYGMGAIPGALFKGGWGPDESGAYLVRQFGVVPAADGGEAGVAIAVKPSDGTYGSGQAMLDVIANAVAAHPPAGGSC